MREQPTPPGDAQTTSQDREHSQAAQKGPDARRRPKAAGEAYPWYVEPAVEGANEADGPFSAACYTPVPKPPAARTVAPSPMCMAECMTTMLLSTARRGRPVIPLT